MSIRVLRSDCKVWLLAALLDPPNGSFIEVVEREVMLVLAVCLAWA